MLSVYKTFTLRYNKVVFIEVPDESVVAGYGNL
jgi:hypothetical protein